MKSGKFFAALVVAFIIVFFTSPALAGDCHYEFDVLTDGRVIVQNHDHIWADYRDEAVTFDGEQTLEVGRGSCLAVLNNVSHMDWFGYKPGSTPPPVDSVLIAIQIGRSDDFRWMRTVGGNHASLTDENDSFAIFNPRFGKLALTLVDPDGKPINLFIFRVRSGKFESLGHLGETRCIGALNASARAVDCGGTDLVLKLLEVREFNLPAPTAP